MSLPDYLLDDDEHPCESCGAPVCSGWRTCLDCRIDEADQRADWAIERAQLEGRTA